MASNLVAPLLRPVIRPGRGGVALALGLVAALASGCGPNCQSSCVKIYSPSECALPVPGRSPAELISRCTNACEDALNYPGELGDYDPNDRNTGGESVHLENEKQAAAWMDCVEALDCRDLSEGYCASPL